MERKFDMLGDPIPEGHGEPGRTGHIATDKNIRKVRCLVVAGMKKPQISKALGISVPTLNKHYFTKQSIRNARLEAVSEMQGLTLLRLDQAAQEGSVSAMKEIGKIARQAELECLASDIRKPAPAQKPLGKKERRKVESKPDGSWGFLSSGMSEEVH